MMTPTFPELEAESVVVVVVVVEEPPLDPVPLWLWLWLLAEVAFESFEDDCSVERGGSDD